MKKIVMLTIAVMALLAGAAGCSSDDDSGGNADSDSGVKSMGFSDPAMPIAVVPGQMFAIELPTTAGTGYEWTITTEPDPSLVSVVEAEGVDSPGDNAGGAVGTTGSTRYEFKAVSSGSATVTFTYAPPSDPENDTTTETFTINVS